MRKSASRLFALAICVAFLTSIMITASARASDYFDSYNISATAAGGGKVRVSVLVNGTRTMQEIGTTSIAIYEYQSSSSSYTKVYTYTTSNTTGMTVKNDYSMGKSVTYQGTPGKYYYAIVTLYAKDASGSEKLLVNTNIVTAT